MSTFNFTAEGTMAFTGNHTFLWEGILHRARSGIGFTKPLAQGLGGISEAMGLRGTLTGVRGGRGQQNSIILPWRTQTVTLQQQKRFLKGKAMYSNINYGDSSLD